MKVLGLILVLALGACRDGYQPEACAFELQTEYSYKALPDGREQGPSTLNQILGAEPDAKAECHGERYTVHFDNGVDATFAIKSVNADGSMIVKLSLSSVADSDSEDVLLWEK